MNNTELISALAISLIFLLAKFVEYKFILKETFELKRVMIDTVMVGVSVITGLFIIQQVDISSISKTTTTAFMGAPDF